MLGEGDTSTYTEVGVLDAGADQLLITLGVIEGDELSAILGVMLGDGDTSTFTGLEVPDGEMLLPSDTTLIVMLGDGDTSTFTGLGVPDGDTDVSFRSILGVMLGDTLSPCDTSTGLRVPVADAGADEYVLLS